MLPFTFLLLIAGDGSSDPAKEWIVDHGGAVTGALVGGAAGFVVGAGAVIGAGSLCQQSGSSCFGSQDAPMLGALFVSPIAGAAVGALGLVLGAAAGGMDDDERRDALGSRSVVSPQP